MRHGYTSCAALKAWRGNKKVASLVCSTRTCRPGQQAFLEESSTCAAGVEKGHRSFEGESSHNMLGVVCRRLIFPLNEWREGTRVLSGLRGLEESQYAPTEVLDDIRRRKLQRLLRHAFDHVPFYRKRFRDSGIIPDEIRGFDDLGRLPPLTKDDIVGNLDRLTAANIPIIGNAPCGERRFDRPTHALLARQPLPQHQERGAVSLRLMDRLASRR